MDIEYPPIVGINPMAEAGYPDVECPAIFLPGCNLRCPYCLNASIVTPDQTVAQLEIHLAEVLVRLRRLGADRVLVSGGEPCIHPRIHNLVGRLGEEGFGVRLSTNGTLPDVLDSLLSHKKVEFVALDVKTSLTSPKTGDRVGILAGHGRNAPGYVENVVRALALLSMAKRHLDIDYEVRTTLDPRLVDEQGLKEIASVLPAHSTWVLQQYRKARAFGGEPPDPYPEEAVERMLEEARRNPLEVHVRWP